MQGAGALQESVTALKHSCGFSGACAKFAALFANQSGNMVTKYRICWRVYDIRHSVCPKGVAPHDDLGLVERSARKMG